MIEIRRNKYQNVIIIPTIAYNSIAYTNKFIEKIISIYTKNKGTYVIRSFVKMRVMFHIMTMK